MTDLLYTYAFPMVSSVADATEVPPLIIDISHWQGDMDADKAVEAGTHGVIIRAGSIDNLSGICYTDYQFENNADKFELRIPMGAYWYYRVNHDPIKQANYFSDLFNGYRFHIPPVVDIEINPNGDTAYDCARWLYKFVQSVQAQTGMTPMVYTRGYFWNDNIYNPTSVWASDYPLWIARYTSLPLPWGNPGESDKLRPYDWTTWHLWQWSADGNGRGAEFGAESSDIDISRFNGTLSDFYAWTDWIDEPEEPEEPAESCTCCEKVKAWLAQLPKCLFEE